MPKTAEIAGGAGGGGIAMELAQTTRGQQIATELAQMAYVVSGRFVSTAHGTRRQEIAIRFSEL